MENNETIAPITVEAETVAPKYINFEVEKNGKKFLFYIPDGSSLGESYDAAWDILQKIVQISTESLNGAKRPDIEPVVQPEGEANVS